MGSDHRRFAEFKKPRGFNDCYYPSMGSNYFSEFFGSKTFSWFKNNRMGYCHGHIIDSGYCTGKDTIEDRIL